MLADTELAAGKLCKADAGGAPVLLYRTAETVYALASTCTHMGGPLKLGTISDGCVMPWHGSTFRFADGTIVRGPASTPQPCYQTRIQDGRIEVPPSHRRCVPQPSAEVVTEHTIAVAPCPELVDQGRDSQQAIGW